MVLQQQVPAAGRPAQLGADDQLRSFAHDFRGWRAAARRNSQFQRNHRRRRAGYLALACISFPDGTSFPQIVGFLCYLTAAIAETNRIPFDLPEAETELVAGFHTEYSSFKFAMFFMAEYANMITVSCLATILFFWRLALALPRQLDLADLSCPAPACCCWPSIAPGTRSRKCAASRGSSSPSSRCSPGGGGLICLYPAGSRGHSGAVLVHHENSGDSVFLRLDARHAAPLPLRPVDVVRLEAAAAGFARESGDHRFRDRLAAMR